MIYKFNSIEIDTKNYRLLDNGKEMAVEPQVFNLIVFLIENKQNVVSRDEILDKLWQGRVVSDTSINNHIKSARKVLGDDGIKQAVIKTIHSRGYQFIAEIKPEAVVLESSNKQKTAKKPLVFMLVLVAIVALYWLNWNNKADTKPILKLVDTQHVSALEVIAVLPFANTRPDDDTDFLGFALANQIIGDLTNLDKFTIRPAGSIRKYVDQIIDPLLVGKELQAHYVLNGNYLKEDNVIRLNVELIEVSNNKLVWRESMQVDYFNTFALQDRVAQKVAKGLNVGFRQNFITDKFKDIPNNALAYEYYLRGISYPFSNEGHQFAVEMLQKSIQLDANYAPAYAHLGNHRRLLEQHGRIVPQGMQNAEWYYKKALELNPQLFEALNNLSGYYTETNRIEEAVIIVKKMLEINPNNAQSQFSLGYIYRYAGMLDQSIQAMEKALKISPNNSRFRSIVATYVSAGKYKQALTKIYLDEGDYGIGYSGIIAFNQENNELAIQQFNKVLTIDADGIWGLISQVYLAVIYDDKPAGLAALTKMVDTNIVDAENYYYFSDFYALLGEEQSSLNMLEKAVNTGYFNYPHISKNQSFNIIQDSPQYIAILEKAKRRHNAFREQFF